MKYSRQIKFTENWPQQERGYGCQSPRVIRMNWQNWIYVNVSCQHEATWTSTGIARQTHLYFKVDNKTFTRRGVLSALDSLCDPLEFAAPVTLQGKYTQMEITTKERLVFSTAKINGRTCSYMEGLLNVSGQFSNTNVLHWNFLILKLYQCYGKGKKNWFHDPNTPWRKLYAAVLSATVLGDFIGNQYKDRQHDLLHRQ